MERVTNALNPRGDAAAAPSPGPYYVGCWSKIGEAGQISTGQGVMRRGIQVDGGSTTGWAELLNEAFRDGYAAGKAAK